MKEARFNKLVRDQKGSTNLIIICTCLVVIIASSIVSDIGYGQLKYIMLKHDAETIINQGAKELIRDRKKAGDYVKQLALRKASDLNELDISISDSGKEITINLGRPHMYSVLKIFGIEKRQLKAVKTAKIYNITSYKGIRPFAIKRQQLVYGKNYSLSNSKERTYGFIQYADLNLGNTSFENNIASGYKGKVSVGDSLAAYPVDSASEINSIQKLLEKCNGANDSYTNHENNCPRIMIIPVVENISFSEHKQMAVVGFTTFYMEDCRSKAGSTILTGRFVKSVVKGSESDGVADFGLYGIDITDRE
ncbi:MAG TPA: hypothetical protein VHT34_05910 [Clostridia bacterium]|nr:hypothetical protein [Clostridia bacterium]